jgi:predicted NBD/HSP70 family sugar kinase
VDIGEEHHRCVVVDERGERLLSRRVFNDEPALLELIADVLALSEDALWAVDINHGGAALVIGLLLRWFWRARRATPCTSWMPC